jgi:hypothetical protein
MRGIYKLVHIVLLDELFLGLLRECCRFQFFPS